MNFSHIRGVVARKIVQSANVGPFGFKFSFLALAEANPEFYCNLAIEPRVTRFVVRGYRFYRFFVVSGFLIRWQRIPLAPSLDSALRFNRPLAGFGMQLRCPIQS